MVNFPTPPNHSRLGFHYYPDILHYGHSELQKWLPELRAMRAGWLTLIAPSDRAIPEYFLRGLIEQGIEPILHFSFRKDSSSPFRLPPPAELHYLFTNYARWGVHYVILFDRPNLCAAWPASDWAQSELVERFLDNYLPLAGAALQSGLLPVFPPLEPGGDYWDTAFLRAALQALTRREQNGSLEKLVLSAYARAGERPLNWGNGGPQRWPGACPYLTPPGCEDQLGFRIFDWYSQVAEAELRNACPILLLEAGSYPSAASTEKDKPTQKHSHRNLTIVQTLFSDASSPSGKETAEALDLIPPSVLACNFWLLTATSDSPYLPHAWYQPDGSTDPVIGHLRQLASSQSRPAEPALGKSAPQPKSANLSPSPTSAADATTNHPVSHYLLIPAYEWGVADWYLDVVRPFTKKYRPLVGFSLSEAALAERVTVVGNETDFPESALNALRAAGCFVERVEGNGTSIASKIREL